MRRQDDLKKVELLRFRGIRGRRRFTEIVVPILFLAGRNDPHQVAGQRPLERRCFVPRRSQQDVPLLGCREEHRHRFGMDRPDDAVRFCCQKPVQLMLAIDRICLGPANTMPMRPDPSKGEQGRLSSSANHVGVLRGLVSAYSQNEFIGEDAGNRWQIASQVACDVEEPAHGLLASGDAVKIAHGL